MLKKITDLPDGVIGFELEGKLEAADYEDTFAPALAAAAADGGEIRLVFVMPKFDGFAPMAIWDDMTVGIKNWKAWTRVALVTDIDWMTHALRWFGWMTPGEVKQFSMAERDAAVAWAAG